MNGSPLSYVGDAVSGVSDPGSDAVAQVMALLKQLEMAPQVPRPAPPPRPRPAQAILGGLGDAILSMASVRAGGQPVPRGPYGQEQLLGEQQYQKRLHEYDQRQQQNEAANRNLRNTVRMTTLRREPNKAETSEFVRDVDGRPHRIRQILDPRSGHVLEEQDLGVAGYAPNQPARTELTPGEVNTERDRTARAREAALSRVDKLRSESIDMNAQMEAIRNHIGQGKTPGAPSKIPFMAGTPGTAGTQWDDIVEEPIGEKLPKAMQSFIGMTYRQAYNALRAKNDANVKEINRLWSIANPGGGPPPSPRQVRPGKTPSSTVQGYTTSEINALREAMNEDERDEFDGYGPEDKKKVLDSAYGRNAGP